MSEDVKGVKYIRLKGGEDCYYEVWQETDVHRFFAYRPNPDIEESKYSTYSSYREKVKVK